MPPPGRAIKTTIQDSDQQLFLLGQILGRLDTQAEMLKAHSEQSSLLWEEHNQRWKTYYEWSAKTESRLSDGAATFLNLSARVERIESKGFLDENQVYTIIRGELEKVVRDMTEQTQRQIKAEAAPAPAKDTITFAWAFEKLATPVFTAILVYILLSFIPTVLAAIGK